MTDLVYASIGFALILGMSVWIHHSVDSERVACGAKGMIVAPIPAGSSEYVVCQPIPENYEVVRK